MDYTMTREDAEQGSLMFDLPYPPSINAYWRHRVFGRRPVVYVTDAGIAYREAVKSAVDMRAKLVGELALTVRLYPPDRRRRDIDNPIKALLDAMTHAGVWVDDSQVKRMTVEMMPSLGGRVLVSISEGNRG